MTTQAASATSATSAEIDVTKIGKALGFSESDSAKLTTAQIVGAIGRLRDENVAKFKEGDDLSKRVVELERAARVSKYAEGLGKVTHVEIPENFAETLADMPGEQADVLLQSYQTASKAAEASGASERILHGQQASSTGDFMDEIAKYREANPEKTFVESVDAVKKAQPALYDEYQEQMRR